MKRNALALAIVIALCVLGFMPFEIQAAEVWSDNFDDGNYDGWTVDSGMGGGFSAADDVLNVTSGGTTIWGYLSAGIWHPSTVTTGTWEFDLMGQLESYTQFTFLYNVSIGDWDPAQGYNFIMEILVGGDTTFKLLRADSAITETAIGVYLVDTPDESNTYHVEITRHSDGQFYIWIDDELVFDVLDATFSISTDMVYTGSQYCGIDNIVVSDDVRTPMSTTTTDTPTPTSTPTPTGAGQPPDMMLIYIAGVAALVLVIVVVIAMKRK